MGWFRMRYLLGLFVFCAWVKVFSLSVVYLTWVDDPTTTMMVRWHTGKEQSSVGLAFREVGGDDWRAARGDSALIGGESYWVHTVGLEDLKPGRTYEFRINGDKKVYRFRTMKKELGEGICFVVGGDAYRYLDLFCKMNAQIALEDPDFVVVGGDIAYTNKKTPYKAFSFETYRRSP